jgi:hypothetical protein
VELQQAPGAAGRWYLVEQGGLVRAFPNDNAATSGDVTTVIDLSGQVVSGGETGLLGMAFHPDFPADPRVFLCYTTGTPLLSRLSEFRSNDGGATLDPASERVLLTVAQPQSNHNGSAWLDELLYVGLGDGGGGGDMHGAIGTARTPKRCLQDPAHRRRRAAYGIGRQPLCRLRPVQRRWGGAFAAEIYAWGAPGASASMRTSQLWIGDVGQDAWEEIDRIGAPASLGWRCREGAHDYNTSCGAAPEPGRAGGGMITASASP